MEAFLVSTLAVAVAEIGDKTQLLALLLAARYRRFWPLAAGILVATVLNHAAAGWLGHWLAGLVPEAVLRWCLAASLLAVAVWTLRPDAAPDSDELPSGRSAFFATTLAFFLAEMGDKTQIATVLLAARFDALFAVVIGTTFGMLLANLPVVWLGQRFAARLPLRAARLAAAGLFALLALWIVLEHATIG
ncbi:TMEM165/GDT1 family protein [Lysobacter sp. CAU 1642]|uniref:GDT1 family protein n=1 Tax=Pseudomarimonas salicorniae TaxID=2933270 RepID=A0ABT0GDB2_9GAMM|nr:TMEM165/GDT1 family protein [Lysobacter sp. CAU 1642]